MNQTQTQTLLTPYAASKIASESLGRQIRPQMVYNYVGKGYIPSVVVDGKKFVEVDVLEAWIEKYRAKNCK